MSREKVKRASEKEEEDRRVRSRSNMDELSLCILTNMEPMRLEICWNATQQKDFRSTQLYPFLRATDNLPSIDVELLEEYLTNYDSEDGLSVVKGRTLGIDENTLHKALQLRIGELAVGTEESSDFNPGSYFKGGMTLLERNQGWRTADALTQELMEWMRFIQKRLGLNRHMTYTAKRLLYATIGSFEDMVFNWAAYVATRIHAELSYKRRSGRIATLLCSNYIQSAIVYELSQPLPEKGKTIAAPVLPKPRSNLLALPWGPGETSQQTGEPISVRKRGPMAQRDNRPVDIQHRTPEENSVKEQFLVQLSQLQQTANELVDHTNFKQQLVACKKKMAEQRQKLLEQDRVNRATKEANSRLEHALGVKQQAWEKERQRLHHGMAHQKQELSNSLNQSKLEVEKMKQQLELNQTKMATLEQEKKTMNDQFRVKIEEMQGEINPLKEVAKKLEEELVSVRRPQGSIEGSIGKLEHKVKQQKYQLEAKDTRILQLESQVRELGALNEDLTARLNIVPINVSDGEDEEVTLEL
uniref:Predicted protein n=1 Tax=Physcomitrium patens TaxID=3218 RepID=A9U4Q1_PHYPA